MNIATPTHWKQNNTYQSEESVPGALEHQDTDVALASTTLYHDGDERTNWWWSMTELPFSGHDEMTSPSSPTFPSNLRSLPLYTTSENSEGLSHYDPFHLPFQVSDTMGNCHRTVNQENSHGLIAEDNSELSLKQQVWSSKAPSIIINHRRESVQSSGTDILQTGAYNLLTPSSAITSTVSAADNHEPWPPFEENPKPTSSKRGNSQCESTKSENGSEAKVDNIIPYEPPRVIKRRHHKPKILTEAQRIEKRNMFLTRNREAASRCRTKKKDWLNELQDDARGAKMENEVLQKMLAELMEEVIWLRSRVGSQVACECQRSEGR